MHDLELRHDCVCVAGYEVLSQVVHDQLVHAVWPEGTLGDLRQVLAGLDVLQQGLINPGEVLATIFQQTLEPDLLIEPQVLQCKLGCILMTQWQVTEQLLANHTKEHRPSWTPRPDGSYKRFDPCSLEARNTLAAS